MRLHFQKTRSALRWSLIVLYGLAGVLHITRPNSFVAILPSEIPFPEIVILITGICEIAGAIGLITNQYRKAAGIALALYAIAVFPANIKHAFQHVQVGNIPDSWWYHAPRLALQPVLVWAALFCVEFIAWPFKQDEPEA